MLIDMNTNTKNWIGAFAVVALFGAGANSLGDHLLGATVPNPVTGEIYPVHSRTLGTVYVTKSQRDSGFWLAGVAVAAIVTLGALRLTGWKPTRSKQKP
jgi:hypothetical protein